MKNKILNIYKPIGISPLDAIKLLQEKNPEYRDVPITYAGRLDPMAEGVLVLLAGDEVHKAEEYMKLDKEYEAEILFGFETDTYDILGIPQPLRLIVVVEDVEKEIKNIVGEISLPLPSYSSYKIKGKPLFMWAREGKLGEIEIPVRTTKIYSTEVLDSYEISEDDLLAKITKKINLVKGDFRQKEILKKWQKILCKNQKSLRELNFKNRLTLNLLRKFSAPTPTISKICSPHSFIIVKAKFNVSSGTYIRSIAHNIGQKLGTGAVLLGLIRTKVGRFYIKDAINIEQ